MVKQSDNFTNKWTSLQAAINFSKPVVISPQKPQVQLAVENKLIGFLVKNLQISALAGVFQWIERQPMNWKVVGSIPVQGTRLSFGQGAQLGMCWRQPINVSLPLFLPPFPLSKNK